MSSPTQRSKDALIKDGWTVAITEKWNPFARIRQDLFGFCDLLAISSSKGFLAVQTTSGSNASARVKKIMSEPKAGIFLAAGGKIVVHSWAKRGARGKRKLWDLKVIEIENQNTI